MADIGYIRVSAVDQNTARQLIDIKLDKIFKDKLSGKDTNRPEFKACLEYLREGDTLHVHSMDRLCRNLIDLEKTLMDLNRRKISVVFHKENLSFMAGKDISPMNKLIFHVMGAVAEFERMNIKERQLEGIAEAKKDGVYKGRVPKIDRKPIIDAFNSGMKKSEIVKTFGISRSYLYKIIEDEVA